MEKTNKRQFGLSIWALQNKNTIYLIIAFLFIFGIISYSNLPKELFPEVNYPTVFIQTIYPGNSAADIENLITNPLEKELKTLDNIKSIKSTSAQDVSLILVEFEPNIKVHSVIGDVKDAVDKAKVNLPNDLRMDPKVLELDFSNFPIITVNIAGDYDIDELKNYADIIKEELEKIKQVSKVNIRGISEKEIQVNVDIDKMQQMGITFNNIENAIKAENISMSLGDLVNNSTRQNIRIVGEYTNIDQIKDLVIKVDNQRVVYLKDFAEIKQTYAESESYARLFDKPVVSLQVIKKNGENLIEAVDNVLKSIDKLKNNNQIPQNLAIAITNNQANSIKKMIKNLEGNLFSGMIIVVFVLLLFLGLRNSIIVGFSIPMSMLMTFAYLKFNNQTINMITLFSLVLALGMLVDNAIVVVEVITRKIEEGQKPKDAARDGISEVAIPIITSTATTLAAFVPLLFWNDIMGEFMKLMPITLIIVLTSSLINALLFAPVLSETLIKPIHEIRKPDKRKTFIHSAIAIGIAILFFAFKKFLLGNIFLIVGILYLAYRYILFDLSDWFQEKLLVKIEYWYSRFINFSLREKNTKLILWFSGIFLILTFIWYFALVKPKVFFFPTNQPNYINIFAELPIDSDLKHTDSVFRHITSDVNQLLEPYKSIVESQLITVGAGVSKSRAISVFKTYNQAMITINFVDYEFRNGINTSDVLQKILLHLKDKYPGINIYSEKQKMGPPTRNPINIEITGNDFDTLINLSYKLIDKINSHNIKGIERLSLDIVPDKPEIVIKVDKQKATLFGLNSFVISQNLRTALFGTEVSKFKTIDDQIPIVVRADSLSRFDINKLLNMTIQARTDKGQLVYVPIISVASITYNTNFDAIKHIDTKRTITISSNVVEGFNANDINNQINNILNNYNIPDGYTINNTGEQKDIQDSSAFMMLAMLIAIALISIILVLQFNSFVKPLIILFTVILSTIGVIGGYATFHMDLVVMMTGLGLIALAGTVVNNAIVLVDYIDYLKKQRKAELDIDEDDDLHINEIKQIIITAGKTRLRPVLLTAITTILGLFTMAIGLNIDYVKMLTEFDPNIYFGGDNVIFWGPLSWAVIFGLAFATILTLIVLPSMYLIANKLKLRFMKRYDLLH